MKVFLFGDSARRSGICLGGFLALVLGWCVPPATATAAILWGGYGGNPQHTALSTVASQPLQRIVWQTPVDLAPQYSGNDLLIHYGSPVVTAANTVIVPVKTGAGGGFEVQARSGADGSLQWTQATDYILPGHDWTPSFSPTLTPSDRLYLPGAGGTVYYRDNPNAPSGSTGQIAFFGNALYGANASAFNSSVFINTPITSDAAGNIYFGFQVTGSNPAGLSGGIARISSTGVGSWVSAATAAGDGSMAKMVMNAAPALSNDGSTLYAAVNAFDRSTGYLVALNSTSLATVNKVFLLDPHTGSGAGLYDDGTASPMVAPDGRVFFGAFESSYFNSHGWMLQYSGDLTQTKTAGAFGWDDTASIVPTNMVPSYHGTSPYLIMTKYNNYKETGGNGINQLAILDPNDTMTDPITGTTVMKTVLTIAGVTPDSGPPGAVREWCINTAVVDPATDSILANSEDGKLYRWNLASNTFTEVITLTAGLGEAYTPTLIGADGTVYAINNATLFALSSIPEPALVSLLALGGGLAWRTKRQRRPDAG